MILISTKVTIQKRLETFNDPGINKSASTKKSGNLFYDPHINVPI